jgi:hypothetical protein
MTAGPSARTIAEIAFLGRGGGQVKALSGFRKGHHTVPDDANPVTQAFLARICGPELSGEGEALFQNVRTSLGYKRAEISLTVASPVATLTTKDFNVEISYALEAADPARYQSVTALRGLQDASLARRAEFDAVFARRFNEISFGFARGVQVEAVIDAIEALPPEAGLGVNYPSDCRTCEITVTEVDATVRCSPGALEMVFPRAGSPAGLMDAFLAVRAAFAVSRPLRALIP